MIGRFATQSAIRSALITANVASGEIHDTPMQSEATAFPYVQIGEGQSLSNDAQCRLGTEDYFDLHIWSRYSGFKEVDEIADAIHTALHHQALTIAGRDTTTVDVISFRPLRDPDGRTHHGVLTLRVRHSE